MSKKQVYRIESPSISESAAQIAEWSAKALDAAKQLRIKTKPLENFWLAPGQLNALLGIPGLSTATRNKLAKGKTFTVAEVASMAMALAEELPAGDARRQMALLHVAKHLMDRLQEGVVSATVSKQSKPPKRKAKTNSGVLYQFKITLLGIKPPIWRRIQIQNCTLDKLHEHIQTSMGWTNSHLHQFEIKGDVYGDPELLDEGFEDFVCVDSTNTMVSEIVPKSGKRFAFKYEYDFGDGWEHEVLFEGCPPVEKDKKYPLCLEGERACPPEDVGGAWGYSEFLDALADPKHERREEFMEWCGRRFSPEKFDPIKATRAMKEGLARLAKHEVADVKTQTHRSLERSSRRSDRRSRRCFLQRASER
jgi:hypothetical protein